MSNSGTAWMVVMLLPVHPTPPELTQTVHRVGRVIIRLGEGFFEGPLFSSTPEPDFPLPSSGLHPG